MNRLRENFIGYIFWQKVYAEICHAITIPVIKTNKSLHPLACTCINRKQ